jgi:predicted Zn-dependent protease with MMP-like domain
MDKLTPDEFTDLAQEAFDELLDSFQLENCPVIIEEDEIKKTPEGLFTAGEFHGCGHIGKNGWHACAVLKRIILYKYTIENILRPDLTVKERVKFVLVHEIGHALGLNEKEIVAALGGADG